MTSEEFEGKGDGVESAISGELHQVPCPARLPPLPLLPPHYTPLHPLLQAVLPAVCMHAKSLQSCPTLCNPTGRSPPGSSVHGILQARTLEQVAVHSSRGSSQPRDRTCVSHISCIGRRVLISPLAPPGKAVLLATVSCFLPYSPYLASSLHTCQGAHTSLTAGAGDAHTGSESLFCFSSQLLIQ